MRVHLRRVAVSVLLALAVTACQAPPERKSVAPPEQALRERAQEQLASGIARYDAGDYEAALKSLRAALDHGLLPKRDQSNARKHMAFIYCVSGDEPDCRGEFRKALEIDPQFDLTPAEAGHPVWGPVYRSVREQMGLENLALEKPAIPSSKARQLLAAGREKYDAGDFAAAQASFQGALKEGLRDKADRLQALKYSAFSLCLMGKQARCRAEFQKIFELDPAFELSPAELGHPAWQRAYAQAREQARGIKDKD